MRFSTRVEANRCTNSRLLRYRHAFWIDYIKNCSILQILLYEQAQHFRTVGWSATTRIVGLVR